MFFKGNKIKQIFLKVLYKLQIIKNVNVLGYTSANTFHRSYCALLQFRIT